MAPRTLSTYALASLEQTKRACGIDTRITMQPDAEDDLLDAIEWASDEIERFLGRQLVTRGNLTEYHTAWHESMSRLYLRQFPIISIVSVAEGSWDTGAWTASLALTASTDYMAETERGALLRLSGGSLGAWECGFERVKVVYSAGYATTAAVPDAIRRVALSLVARRWAEKKRGAPGAQSVSDAMGSVTRFLPAELLRMEQDALQQFRRFLTTGRVA